MAALQFLDYLFYFQFLFYILNSHQVFFIQPKISYENSDISKEHLLPQSLQAHI